ncbi:MAG: hypothetical protein FD156_548 [Nitrospirae bacterium]|nr:MAG: hypothetical protein FD156_548 [Nitrospirota bacterium]
MIKHIMIFTILAVVAIFSSSAMATEGYELLFQGTTSKLTTTEKQQIFKVLGFHLSKDKKFITDETCGADVSPNVKIDDLNGDGIEEVFVTWGNTCTSGQAGATVSLLIKGTSGKYIDNLGFPAIEYEKLSTKNKGFPDLKFGGPGFCHPVWRWVSNKYQHFRNEPEVKGGCDGVK